MILGYKVYYADGWCLSTKDVAWEKMPDEGVQVVIAFKVFKDGKGRHTKYGMQYHDYYYKRNGIVESSNEAPPDATDVKKGCFVSDAEWERIRLLAVNDWEF